MSADDGRSFVKVDRYALDALAREHGLTVHETWLLLHVTLWANWRNREWTGTLTDLADGPPTMGRNTVDRGLRRLTAFGLIEEAVPRRRGAPRFTLRVLAYARLVVATTPRERERDEALAPISATHAASRAAVAPQSRRSRANQRDRAPSEQPVREPRGSDAVREGVVREQRVQEWCQDPDCDGREATGRSVKDGTAYCDEHAPFEGFVSIADFGGGRDVARDLDAASKWRPRHAAVAQVNPMKPTPNRGLPGRVPPPRIPKCPSCGKEHRLEHLRFVPDCGCEDPADWAGRTPAHAPREEPR